MKISDLGNSTVSEVQEPDKSEEAKKVKTDFRVQSIVKERPEESKDSAKEDPSRMGHLIDFVARSRKRQAKVTGKKRIRAIRAYESIASFEDDFIYKGRFSRRVWAGVGTILSFVFKIKIYLKTSILFFLLKINIFSDQARIVFLTLGSQIRSFK